jgi:ATP-binding cassette, subfamily B, multidrug efflux pump
MHDFGYFEEEKLGKPYDLRLMGRLLPYARPYWGLFLISVVLIFLVTGIELAVPYVTKVAIDRHIVPQSVEGKEAAGRSRSLIVDPSDPDVRAVAEKYPGLFEATDGGKLRITYSDLSRINRDDRARLRRDDLSGVARLAMLFVVLIVMEVGLNFSRMMLMEVMGQRIMRDLRLHLFAHIQNLSMAFFTRNSVGRLVTRATNDIQNMYELFVSVIAFLFKDLALLAGIAVVLLSIQWRLALVSFAVLPFVLYASFLFARQARGAFRELRIKVAEINSRFSETIGGIRVLQTFRQERRNYDRFQRLNHENYLAGMRQIRVFAVFMPLIELLGSVAIAVVIFYGGTSVLQDRITLGELVAFISYMKMFFRPIRDIAEKYNIMQNAMASAERIFLIFDSRDRIPDPPADQARADLPGRRITSVEVEGVSFGYLKDEPVLEEITFAMGAGETVALVGPTGSGKTSLINLLMRFYEPQNGLIRINGVDIRRVPAADLRNRMALVTQDPYLFSGTIRENVLQGVSMDEDALGKILDAANCSRLLDRLPQGVDTSLSEGGASISSGERQLLSIARAFARDPELIILDEATSYIDSDTEARIQEALARLMRGRTAIIVAHRLSTAWSADRIIVLYQGRIRESGTHAELMAKGGFYHQLHQLQNGDFSSGISLDHLKRS